MGKFNQRVMLANVILQGWNLFLSLLDNEKFHFLSRIWLLEDDKIEKMLFTHS